MIKSYRKKPVIIEAIQYLSDDVVEDVIKFTHGQAYKFKGGIEIPTLEGNHLASIGDFIIKGIKGEFYPCKPDIFNASYEEVIK